jgi:ribonuclease R
MDEGVETEAALYRNGIPVDFSEETLAQTKQLPTAVSAQDKIDTCNKLVEQKLLTLLEHHLYISKLNLPTQNGKNIISF